MTFAPAGWKTFRDRENPPALLEAVLSASELPSVASGVRFLSLDLLQ